MPVNNNSKENNERGLGLTHTRRPARLVNTNNQTGDNNKKEIDISETISEVTVDTSNLNIIEKRQNNVSIHETITTPSSKNSAITDTVKNVQHEVSPVDVSNEEQNNTTIVDNDNKESLLAPPFIPKEYSQECEKKKSDTESVKSNENLEIIRQAKAVENVKDLETKVTNLREKDSLWIRVSDVPSNNKVFKSTNSVFYRKYNYGDYEDINNPDIPLRDRYALSLQGMRVDELDSKLLLPFCDFSYVSVLRRLESQGTRKFSIPYTCNTCGQIGAHTFTLDQITFNTCDVNIPIKVRFRSYPEEIFEFKLVTIGDVISLIDNDIYYKKERGEYKTTVNGNLVVDRLAVLCSACTSHKYKETYSKLNSITDNQDYRTLQELRKLLNPGLAPMEFKCSLYLPKTEDETKIDEENEKKLDALRDSNGELPQFMKLVQERRSNKICGAKNTVDIDGGDVLILPFRESEDDTEYGILS